MCFLSWNVKCLFLWEVPCIKTVALSRWDKPELDRCSPRSSHKESGRVPGKSNWEYGPSSRHSWDQWTERVVGQLVPALSSRAADLYVDTPRRKWSVRLSRKCIWFQPHCIRWVIYVLFIGLDSHVKGSVCSAHQWEYNNKLSTLT